MALVSAAPTSSVVAAAPVPARGAAVRPARSAVRDGSLAVRILVIQASVAAVVAALGRDTWILAVVICCATPAVVLAVGRAGGRPLTRYLALRWQHSRRRRLTGRHSEPALTMFAQITPDLTVRQVDHRDRTVGIGADAAGWYVAIALGRAHTMRGGAVAPVPIGAFAGVLTETALGVHLQLVTHTVPTPHGPLVATSPAAQSYRRLSGGQLPAQQQQWLVVRLNRVDAMDAAAARGGGVEGVQRTLCAIGDRLVKVARAGGLPAEMLDAEELTDALRIAGGVVVLPGQPTGQPIVGVEDWRQWRVGALSHRCYWVSSVPAVDRAATLLSALSSAGGDSVSVALTIAGGQRATTLRWLVRVGAAHTVLPDVCVALEHAARQVGARLMPLEGEHGPAAYAAAPTGSGLV